MSKYDCYGGVHYTEPDFDDTEPEAWERFTKRTGGHKLVWLEKQLEKAGIACRQNGNSFHAPILEVDATRIDDAWEILTPVDDIDDDDERFL